MSAELRRLRRKRLNCSKVLSSQVTMRPSPEPSPDHSCPGEYLEASSSKTGKSEPSRARMAVVHVLAVEQYAACANPTSRLCQSNKTARFASASFPRHVHRDNLDSMQDRPMPSQMDIFLRKPHELPTIAARDRSPRSVSKRGWRAHEMLSCDERVLIPAAPRVFPPSNWPLPSR